MINKHSVFQMHILKLIFSLILSITSFYMMSVYVNAEIADEPSSPSDLLSEEKIQHLPDTPIVTEKSMTLSFNSSLYDVTVDGTVMSDGDTVELKADNMKTMVVTQKSTDAICVIVGGNKLNSISSNIDSTTNLQTATYQLTLTNSMSADKIYVCSTAYTVNISCPITSDNGKFVVSYPNGRYLPEHMDYILCFQLLPGYTHSTLDLYSDGTNSGGHSIGDFYLVPSSSDSEIKSDPEKGYYVYRCDSSLWEENHKIRIAGKYAQSVMNAEAITADVFTGRFFYNGIYTDVSAAYKTVLKEISEPKKEGYKFIGWYTTSGEKYNFSSTVDGNVNLFAHWEETCQVTFTGDTINTVSKTVLKNNTVSKPVTPVRLGYNFLGWYTDDLGCDLYDFDTPVASDITLYGIWEYDPIDISKATVTKIGAKTYNGSAINPALKLTYNGSTLKSDKDYTVTYSSNVKVGTATVKITGIGVYKNARTVHFLINPKPTKITKISNNKSKKLTITWKKATSAAGYQVYRSTSKNGTYQKIAAVKSSVTSYTDKKVKTSKTYYYKVTVIQKNGQYYESTKSNVKYAKVKK